MPLTSAEKQQRYRTRHLGPQGDKVRLTTCVSIEARDQLDRLAWHLGYAITGLIEELAARTERAVEAKLSGKALDARRRGRDAIVAMSLRPSTRELLFYPR